MRLSKKNGLKLLKAICEQNTSYRICRVETEILAGPSARMGEGKCEISKWRDCKAFVFRGQETKSKLYNIGETECASITEVHPNHIAKVEYDNVTICITTKYGMIIRLLNIGKFDMPECLK